MATGETAAKTDSRAKEMLSQRPVQGESQDVTIGKENQVPGETSSTEEAAFPIEEKESNSDEFNEWCRNVIRELDQIKDKKKLDILKRQVIQAEEMFESLKEGYDIESRLLETKAAVEKLKERLNIPKENSRNVQTNISISQESVLQRFEKMYEQWNTLSGTDGDSDLCKMHEECYKYCKSRFQEQMKKLVEVAKPLSRNQSYDANEEQIIQEALKELARNTVGIDLEKLRVEGKKELKAKKELEKLRQDCMEICWITLIQKVPMRFEFESYNAKEETFEGASQGVKAIVIKPAVFVDKDTIKIRGMVRQTQVDTNNKLHKLEDNSLDAQTGQVNWDM